MVCAQRLSYDEGERVVPKPSRQAGEVGSQQQESFTIWGCFKKNGIFWGSFSVNGARAVSELGSWVVYNERGWGVHYVLI